MASLSGAATFLNNGQAPANVTTGSESMSQLPSWYTSYAQNILGGAAQYAGQGAPVFPGPQVAGQTADTQQSYDQLRGLAGTYGGLAAQGANETGNVIGAINQGGALAAAQPNLGAAAGLSGANAASPYLGSAQSTINTALQGQNPLTAASPYLSEANAGAAPNIQNYLNPYTQNVVKNIGDTSAQNLTNNLLPALQGAFTSSGGGGHYGAAGNTAENFAESQLGRNVAQDTQKQQEAAMQSGYGQALGAAQQQAGLQAGLAGTAGGLQASGTGLQLQGAAGEAGLGATAGGLTGQEQSNLANIAGLQGNLAATNLGQGLQAGTQLGSLGATGANTGLGLASGLNTAGQQQQQQTQSNLNAAMNNYYQQFNWPLTGANAMEGALSGIQTPTVNTAYQTGPLGAGQYANNGPLSTILGGNSYGQAQQPHP
jgi:hypothetical protein